MDDYTYLQWLEALATGASVPGEHPPSFDPRAVP